MEYLSLNFFKKRKIKEYGSLFFIIGVFFLPSTLFIGILLLFPAALIGSFLQKKPFLKDKWNFPFLIFGLLITINSLLQNFVLRNNYQEIWNPILSIMGMANWLPFIWFFWAFQPYLDSKVKRKNLTLTLVASTFPVLITGFGQYFFNWTGPFETLNGLIIWYQRPIEDPAGLSGLFNHQNYAGSWLNFIWPLTIALFLEKKNFSYKKFISLTFLFSVGLAGFLTFSRNAWLGLLISIPIMFGKRLLKLHLVIAIIVITFFGYIFLSKYIIKLDFNLGSLVPEKFLLEFTQEGYEDLDVSRLEIFLSALKLIKISPIFGIGAASFPAIYLSETTFWKGHSHNLILELAISYGLPATIIFFITVNLIIIFSGKKIFSHKNINDITLFDKAIWTSMLFFLISQLFDIQYFDGKISLVAWILIASLKNIIEENSNNFSNEKL